MANCCAKFNEVKYQVLATVAANIVCLGQGCGVGWLSPSLPVLLSDASPLTTGAVTKDEAGWIGSVLSLGALFGTFFFGVLSNFIGTKMSMLLCVIPTVVSWIMIIFATQVWHICVARFMVGLTGGAVYICIPLFVAEIASDHIRGQLSSLMQVSFNTGILIGYIYGTFLDYTTVPYVMFVLPTIFLCVFTFLPNTPQHLLRHNRIADAEKSLRFYRNCRVGHKHDEASFQEEFERFKTIAKQNASSQSLRFADFKTRAVLKGMCIGPTLMAISQFSGTFTISSYAAIIFKESGSTIEPNLSAIIMGSVQIVGTYCASSLIDKLGRKVLLLISTCGTTIGLVVTGTYAFLSKSGYDLSSLNTLPVISLSFVIFIAAIGIIPVPYVLVNEIFPRKIRKISATICTCTVSLFAFIMLRTFPIMLGSLSLYGCLWFFSGISVLGIAFTAIAVTETKGKNLDTVENDDI